ncbi:MAG: hypothetical protein H6813_07375 [Phycisphaeraceae bacterium]|nr:hypothetical protein [Phycisphaeraceae bacterium]MCB9848316.1 hypothetical protein [Phycisphaeraceae bacterium]
MSAESATTQRRANWRRLLLKTPLRDLIRGNVSGRLDMALHTERAGLPAPLADLVLRVTKRTRLRRLEKADVARELSAHFAEGLAGGADAVHLIERFGDPKLAARLIRKAKKRNRSRIVRAVKRTTAATFATIALLYAGVLIWYVAGSGTVNPTHDYLADMNARAAAVPEADRAWPVYREALLSMGEDPTRDVECWTPADPCWPDIAAFLEANQPQIESIRRAAAMPGLGYIADTALHEEDLPLFDPEGEQKGRAPDDSADMTLPLLYTLLPYLSSTRTLTRTLRFDAVDQMESGNVAAAIADIDAMLGIASQLGENDTLISQLVRISQLALAIDAAETILHEHAPALTHDNLAALAHAFRPGRTEALTTISLDGEWMMILDVEQHAFSDNGRGDGRLRPEMLVTAATELEIPVCPQNTFLAAPVSAAMPGRASFHKQAEEVFHAADRLINTPMWERDGTDFEELVDRLEGSTWSRMRWSYLLLFIPAIDKIATVSDKAAMQADACRVAIALHRYRLANNNRWPGALDQLVPAYLDAVPIDRFDGAPLRYRLDEHGEPILYSVGANFIDDGGVPALDEDGWPTNAEAGHWRPRSEIAQMTDVPAGDLIFWPPLPIKPSEPDTGAIDP